MRFRRRPDIDFRAEIDSHLRLEADRLIAEGMTRADAEAAARRAFGNVTTVQERFYESRRWQWWEQTVQDLRYGLRSLRKTPAFTVAVILTVALGVGANTAVFSLMDAVLLRSLPVQNPRELVFLETAGSAGTSGPPPYPCFVRLRAETRSFLGLAAFASDELRISIDGRPEQVMGQIVSGNYFELLGLRPALGRLLTADDEALNPPVAVISERYWRRRFGGDPAVIGRSVSFGNRTFTIVGVTHPEFFGLQPGSPVDVTSPISVERSLLADAGAFWLHGIVGRLKPAISMETARAESDAVFRSFMSDTRIPTDIVAKHFQRLEIEPAGQGMGSLRRRFSKPLLALMGVVGLVLLLAVANIANLLLARGLARAREFAIRLAAGAGRGRIVRQLLTETLLLFLLGAVPGVLISAWAVSSIETLFQEGRRAIAIDAQLNWRVLAFLFLITLVAGLVAGLMPAWRAFRTDPDRAIREGQARTGESRSASMAAQALVSFQVGLSLVLLVGAAAFVATLVKLRGMDAGFRSEGILTMSVRAPEGYGGKNASLALWNRALEAVRALPDVKSAALSTYTPLSGRDRGALIRVPGYQPATTEDATIHVNQVSEGYFETIGISLVAGRMLTERDAHGAVNAALINESAARKYFAGGDPVGASIEFPQRTGGSSYRIVGVVRDTKHMNLREPFARFVFLPVRQPKDVEQRVTLSVASQRHNGETALLQPVRDSLVKIDPSLLVSDVITLRRQLDSTLLTERLLSGLSAAFGVLGMILAAVGLYGVLTYRIGRQRQSIGVRMALGASPSSILVRVMRQTAWVIFIGLGAGLPFAFLAARAAGTMLWNVKATDPALYFGCAVLLCVVGLASAYLPARRASGIQPSEALRHG